MCDYTRNILIFCYNKGMANNIVQLTDYNDNNIYPIAGAAAQGSITKSMLEEGVFEGPELSEPSTVAYVATDNIQDGAVTSDKIDWTTYSSSPVKVGTWIDGKELWRKTITATVTLTANTPLSTEIPTGVSTYSQMIKLDMRIDERGDGQTVDIFNYYGNDTNYFRAFFRTNTIQIRACAPQLISKSCAFTIHYTVPSS